MGTAAKSLIEAVDRERTKLKMSDRKFSMEVLGVSPSYWCLLKAGQRPPTLNLLTLFCQKLPEITPAVGNFVMGKGNDGQNQNDPAKSRVVNRSLGHLSMPEAEPRQKSLKKGM